MDQYNPELGQAMFGQPHKEFEVPEIMDAAMQYIRYELGRVMWNIRQENYSDPFGNTGEKFDCDCFSAHAYSWSDGATQPWNFKCGDVEISWYKYMEIGRAACRERG